jgi:hypothetical protein
MDLRNAPVKPRLLGNGIGICDRDCPLAESCSYLKNDYYCYPHLYQTYIKLAELLSKIDRWSMAHKNMEPHMRGTFLKTARELNTHLGIQELPGGK